MNTISNLESIISEIVEKTEFLKQEIDLLKSSNVLDEEKDIDHNDNINNEDEEVSDECDGLLLSKKITALVGLDASKLISKFFFHKKKASHNTAMIVLNKLCSNKKQRNNIIRLSEIIKSGDIVSNYIYTGDSKLCFNAKLIHNDLPREFANRFSFSIQSVKLFADLLNNAKILYSIGESVKYIDSRIERARKCEELWKQHISSIEKQIDNTHIIDNDTNDSLYRELQQNEQRIVICGKQFWPVKQFDFNHNPDRTYAVVWGAGTFLEQFVGLLLSKGDTIESVAVWLMQNSRSLRLMTKEGAAVFHSMVSAIKSHPELFKDNNETILPVTTSAPEGYFQ